MSNPYKISLFNKYDDDSRVPEHTQESIEDYLINGFPPGGFLEAMLCNDLHGAVVKSDFVNKKAIAAIATWLYSNVPAGAIGSKENVLNWLNDVDFVRSKYLERLRKEKTWDVLNGTEDFERGWYGE